MIILLMKLMMIYSYNILLYWYWSWRFTLITKSYRGELKVTRGIECGERGYGDESGECGVCGEWDGGVECGSNRVKLRLNMEMRMIVVVVNVEIIIEIIMLKSLIPLNSTPNNQSKPIVSIPSFSLSFPFYNFSLYYHNL